MCKLQTHTLAAVVFCPPSPTSRSIIRAVMGKQIPQLPSLDDDDEEKLCGNCKHTSRRRHNVTKNYYHTQNRLTPLPNVSIRRAKKRAVSIRRAKEQAVSIKQAKERAVSIRRAKERAVSIRRAKERAVSIRRAKERAVSIRRAKER